MPPTTNGAVEKPINMAQKTTTVTENSVRYTDEEALPSTSWSCPQSTNMRSEEERLKTFEQWPVEFIPPRAMSSAGFYYLKKEDLVRCAFCGVVVGRWVPGDDPMTDHKKWAPECRFIKRISVENIPLGETNEINNVGTEGYDTCGSLHINLSQEQSSSTNILESHAGYLKTRDPAFPHYAAHTSRLMSYESWPISLKLKPDVLSDAGFFYTGKSDQTVCFHCGGGLKDWEETDEPWIEHARWFSRCPFVLIVKGKEFVDEVSGNKSSSHDTKSSTPVDSSNNTCKPSGSDTTEKTEEKALEETCIEKPVSSTESTNDGRLCKICYTDEMGVVFLPCGHIVSCVKCALSLRTCAVCRKPVTATFRAFLS